jgi:LmbE family N-acetylglucosaminyl deacetylase
VGKISVTKRVQPDLMNSSKSFQRIYLSPHLDDAALSCGGRIYQERQAGLQALVVTIFAGDAPPEALALPTPILADLHTRWELESTPNPVSARRNEDREALSILEADVQHWKWPECVYRRHPLTGSFLYPSEESLWGKVDPGDQETLEQLMRHLAELPLAPRGQVYVPLTVGDHVDHHLVRQAAEAWGAPEGELVYYEEYPYAEHPEALRRVIGNGPEWRPESFSLDVSTLTAKAAAVARYRSQISTFFASADEIFPRLKAYAATACEGQGWGERYWHQV